MTINKSGVKAIAVGELLREELRIPHYQRPYSWEPPTALRLLDDVEVRHDDHVVGDSGGVHTPADRRRCTIRNVDDLEACQAVGDVGIRASDRHPDRTVRGGDATCHRGRRGIGDIDDLEIAARWIGQLIRNVGDVVSNRHGPGVVRRVDAPDNALLAQELTRREHQAQEECDDPGQGRTRPPAVL